MTSKISRPHLSVLAAALAAFSFAAPAEAQKISAECKPVVDAQLKAVTTPNHMYMSSVRGSAGGVAQTGESITVGNTTYVKTSRSNKWIKSPMAPQELLKDKQDNLATYSKMTCKKLPDETVNGVSANVYDTSTKDEDGDTIAGKIWVDKSLGLPIKSEMDTDVGGGAIGKSHTSTRTEYTNVHAPSGV